MSSSPKRLAALATAALAVAGLTVLAPSSATANPAGTALVISEVYGGGGSANATASYKTDFVELYNPTGADISLNGKSLQYRSTGFNGTPANVAVASLPNLIVKAGGSFLAEVSAPNAAPAGGDLPTPDFSTTALNMAQANGQVILADGISPITQVGNLAAAPGVIDMVGYGATPNSFETAVTGTATGITTSVSRSPGSGTDTDNNALDFAAPATPSPVACGAPCVPPPTDGTPATIAEIQGDNVFTSPLVGDTVITEGVVTAAYPAGGFFGFYLQTEGTGGEVDPAGRTHSDGVFVRQTVAAGAVTVEPGDYVSVTGTVTEFAGQTQVEVSDAADIEALPGTPDPVTATTTTSWPDTAAEKEALEGMLYTPEGDFTISNNFATNQFGELGLATGDQPLIQPTEVARPGTPAYTAQEADNAARAIVLDDGASTDFLQAANQTQTPPYISNDTPFRTGATGTFADDVILTQGGSPSSPSYRFEPLVRVVGPANAESPYTVADTRTNAPDADRIADDGEPAVKVASFNVLNYFTTLGDANDDNIGDGGCTAFNDRAGDGNSVQGGCNQRGAWDPQDFNRQQTKIVAAINALDADVVGLMEIENSAVLGETPNEATQSLVAALNAASAPGTWAANPTSASLPPVAEMDVITNAIIYKPASVVRVGPSMALGDQSTGNNTATDEAFANAREPIGQKFAPAAGGEEFLVVVNHFKSKGSAGPFPGDTDQNDGQGAGNQSRIRQATALKNWIPTVQGATDDVLLIGDFNSYTKEDPLQVLYDAGYQDFETLAGHDKYSYSFSGLSGSLDHVIGNAGAVARFTGADVWNVNSVESIAMEYSRFNYSGTDFHSNGPFRASDHDPVVVGLSEGDLDIQILGTNDFHGRIANDPTSAAAGAAVLAGAVKQLRAANANTVFAAAGDLIGASTFESFIDKDKPTIDALNEAGLEVSSAGNHEFDQGYHDLVDRVMQPYDATTNPQGGAEWDYIAANLKLRSTGLDALTPSWTKTMDGVKVGFVGAVTEHLPELVSPAGIADIEVEDIVTSVNEEADDLKAGGADIIVMLVHEGAGGTDCATMDDDPTSDFGSIIAGVDDNVDAIISGHTHLEYNCSFPVAGWAGRPVTERPVVSAGQYGAALNQIVFTVDPTTHEVLGKGQAVLRLKAANAGPFNYPVDAPTQAIVDLAVANADVLGAAPLGQLGGPFTRAKFADGITENRGGESTLGNLVAEAQRWATRNPESGSAQIAFMNPGGLRADMAGGITGETTYPKTLTYKQAATVQPFANTLVNMDLTGAQIKATLEQQWQPAGSSRPFLRLGSSKGFTYTYDPTKAAGSRITGMWLDGAPIVLANTYSVTVNSFLSSGGDNFTALAGGTNKQDTGKTDLQGMVDYMAANTPLQVDYRQQAVGVTFPAGAPASYVAGTDHVKFDLSSLSMTDPSDTRDTSVTVKLGATTLGTFPVTTTLSAPGNANSNDEAGTASVDVMLPAGTPAGSATLLVEGVATGTSTTVPVTVASPPGPAVTTVTGSASAFAYGKAAILAISVSPATASGTVEVTSETGAKLGSATITGGQGELELAAKSLKPGSHLLTLKYLGNSGHAPSTSTVSVLVKKANPKVKIDVDKKIGKGEKAKVVVKVKAPAGVEANGKVTLVVKGTGTSLTVKLDNGKAVFKLPKFSKVGTYTLKAKYLGSNLVQEESETIKVKVTK